MPRSIIDSGQISEHTTDPTVNDDVTAGYDYGSNWLNLNTNVMWECVNPTTGAAVWNKVIRDYELATIRDNNAAPAVFNPASMNNYALYNLIQGVNDRATDSNPVFFNPSGADYIECTSGTYEVRANVIYRGTGIWTPNSLFLLVSRSTASGTGYFRIYDYTHAQEICERTFTNVAKQIQSFTLTPTEIARFQTGVSILEYQLRREGTSKIYLHAAGLYTNGVP